ncbi:50S ribosomal protein L7/L12 [Candidatus Giovannonibacteria bacterium]|nr:50S ribosomal protein L7/L12 [Candidatus Giovannonibacteria bacterium]
MANLDQIVEEVSKLTALELSDLVKKIEEKFGVSAAMPVMAAGAGNGAAADAVEEKTSFNVEIKEGGGQKIQVIKVLREVLGLGLKEAKDMVDQAPKVVKEGADKATADELKAKLEAAGATVELK